jgi:hypothetical protein
MRSTLLLPVILLGMSLFNYSVIIYFHNVALIFLSYQLKYYFLPMGWNDIEMFHHFNKQTFATNYNILVNNNDSQILIRISK